MTGNSLHPKVVLLRAETRTNNAKTQKTIRKQSCVYVAFAVFVLYLVASAPWVGLPTDQQIEETRIAYNNYQPSK